MKRHLLLYSALFAGVAGSALAGGYAASPYGAVHPGAAYQGAAYPGVAPGGVVHQAPAAYGAAAPGQPIYVNGRSVYDDRSAAGGAGGGAMWGGSFAGAAHGASYGAPIVTQQVVGQDYLLQQGQAAYGASGVAQAGYGVAHQVSGGAVIEQTTTTQDVVGIATVQPVLSQAVVRRGWGPRVFVGVQGGMAMSGAFSTSDETLRIDRGYNFGAHAGVSFGGGWRAKVEYIRLAGKIDLGGGGDGGGNGGGGGKPGHGGGKPTTCYDPASGCVVVNKPGYGKPGHGGKPGDGGGNGGGGGFTDYTANAAFVTVEKAFAVSKTFQPYVGLGVGYVAPSIEGANSLGGSMGVKASVGASVVLSDQLEAFGEYAYVNAPNVECSGCGDAPMKVKYDTHLLSAGLRISFN